MDKMKDALQKVLEYSMAAMLAVMVAMVFLNVALRYLFGSGIAAGEEIARLMFVWLVFTGATLAVRQHKHLGLELFQAWLPPPVRKVCAVVSHLLMLYALWLFISGSWTQMLIGTRTFSTILRFPMIIYTAAGFLPALAMTGLIALNLYRILAGSPKGRMPGDKSHDEVIAELIEQ